MDQTLLVIDPAPVAFDLEAVSQKLRARSTGKSRDILERLAGEARPLARPRAGARLSGLTVLSDDRVRMDDDAVFTSPLLSQHLGGLGRAFPYLATEGRELAEWGGSFSGLERVFANALQHAALKQAEALLEKTLLEKFGLPQVSAMNPGSLPDWPITQQAPLFKALGPLPEKLGVTLLPTFMMKPEHTVSGVFFQTDTKFFNCQLCPRPDCPSRKAPFAEA
jgi:hypothetical protein